MTGARQNPEETNSKKKDNGASPGNQEAAPWEAGVKPRKTEHRRNKETLSKRREKSRVSNATERSHNNCKLSFRLNSRNMRGLGKDYSGREEDSGGSKIGR